MLLQFPQTFANTCYYQSFQFCQLKSDVTLWFHFVVSQELKCPIVFMCSLTICMFFLMFTCLYNLPIFKIMCMCFVFFPNAYP